MKITAESNEGISFETRGVDKIECASDVYLLVIFKSRYNIPDRLKKANNVEIDEEDNEAYFTGSYDITIQDK